MFLVKIFTRTAAIMLVSCVILVALVVTAVVMGLIYFPRTTVAVLVWMASIVLLLSLCKAAAMGNVYCPTCGSEDNDPTQVHEVDNPSNCMNLRICNACRHIWQIPKAY